jgi:hypothetical protein
MQTFYQRLRRGCMAIAALAMASGAHAAAPDLLSRELCRQVVPQVASAYAGVLEPVRRAGHCIAGDFNGDGKPDVLMVVKVLVASVPASAGIKTVYPFFDKDPAAAVKGRLQFLVLHSSAGSVPGAWTQADKLLLDGASPIMVLRHPDLASDMERITQRSPALKELQLPRRKLHGEAVMLGTEAVTAILYWSGTAWVFHEDPAGP